jgi:hypothetical protein
VALLFMDGFEGHPDSNTDKTSYGPSVLPRWVSWSLAVNSSVYRTAQPTVANSRSVSSSFSNENRLQLPPLTEVIVGVGYRTSVTGTTNIFNLARTGYGSQGIALSVNGSTGTVSASIPNSSGAPGTILGTSEPCTSINAWFYVEARVKLGSSDGEIEVRVNGSEVLNLTNVNTASGSIASYEALFLTPNVYNLLVYWDDLYVCDTSGTTNNTFIGPLSVYTLMPTSNGSVTQLTPVGSASNWQAVNEVLPNTTTYNETSTTGHQDFYRFQSIPVAVGSVQGVMLRTRNTTPDNGGRQVKMNLKSGSAILSSALKYLSLGTWVTEQIVAETDPSGNMWTKTSVDAVEGGVEAG